MASTTTTKRAADVKRAPRAGRTPRRAASAPVLGAATEAVEVTGENFETLLLASAEQAAAIGRGAARPARTYTLERTERDTVVPAPRAFTAQEVTALRHRLRVSQGVFARMVGVGVKLAQAWEAGTRVPNGPAARMLEILDAQPRAIIRLLQPKRAGRAAG